MKTALTALVLALVAPLAHAWTPCDPDPAAAEWPVLCRPAAPGHDARCMSMSPFSSDVADGYAQALPYDFVYAMRHAEYTRRAAAMGFVWHEDGLISYAQLLAAVQELAANPPRPGVPSGSTETASVNGSPLTVPIYTEARFSPATRPSVTVSSPRSEKIRQRIYDLEYAVRYRGWAFPGTNGELYGGGASGTVGAHIRDLYNGYGYAPEVLQAVYDLWLPEPTTGHCELD